MHRDDVPTKRLHAARASLRRSPGPSVRTALATLRVADLPDLLRLARASRHLHLPWVHLPLTLPGWRRYLDRSRQNTNISYLIRRRDTGAIVGVVNMSEIVRGVFQSAYLGFYVHAEYAGQGLMFEGLRAVVSRAFRVHRLHRLEANIQRGNRRSILLVKRLR